MAESPTPSATAKRRRLVSRVVKGLLLLVLLMVCLIYFLYVLPFWGIPFNKSRHGRVPLTPPWALECWLWEDDHNTEAYLKELVEGYAQHDLPVGAVVIDSPWSERYNDFKIDENRYPHLGNFIKELHERDCRVVLGMPDMENSRSKDTSVRASSEFFDEPPSKGSRGGGGSQFKWWKGE